MRRRHKIGPRNQSQARPKEQRPNRKKGRKMTNSINEEIQNFKFPPNTPSIALSKYGNAVRLCYLIAIHQALPPSYATLNYSPSIAVEQCCQAIQPSTTHQALPSSNAVVLCSPQQFARHYCQAIPLCYSALKNPPSIPYRIQNTIGKLNRQHFMKTPRLGGHIVIPHWQVQIKEFEPD